MHKLLVVFLLLCNPVQIPTDEFGEGTLGRHIDGVADSNFLIQNPHPSQMPMHIVYPRPNSETTEHARHRWAHPEMRYEIPIGVQGGSWPFKYEIIESPDGAKIGQYPSDSDYGVVRWTPTQSENDAKFHVRITDQELKTIDAIWSVTVSAEQFVFIQDNWEGEKTGAIDTPLEDVEDWYKSDREDDTFHNKIIVFREGNYLLLGGDATSGNIRLDENSKTPSLIGFPDEVATLNASRAKVFTDVNALPDVFIANLKWENSRQDVNNAHFIWAVGDVTRSTFWNNEFHSHGPGLSGRDNPAGVFVSDKKNHKKHILYKHNKHSDFLNGSRNGSYVDIYYSSYVLIESNEAIDSDNGYGFWAKGTTSFVTIRDNRAFQNVNNGGITVNYGPGSPELSHSHEIAWNQVVFKPGNGARTTLMFADSRHMEGQTFNSHVYRNTFVNGSAWVRFKGRENYQVNANVVVSKNLNRWNSNVMDVTSPNLVGGVNDEITDPQGLLQNEYREEFLGKVGHEFILIE